MRALSSITLSHAKIALAVWEPWASASVALAFRCAMNPEVLGTVCFYATDIHKGGLGLGMNDNSYERAGEIKGELLMVWGRQDPHIPTEGRMKVLNRLNELGTRLNWHEVNGAHAFLRDEGVRYDPDLARSMFGLALDLFHRAVAVGSSSLAQSPVIANH